MQFWVCFFFFGTTHWEILATLQVYNIIHPGIYLLQYTLFNNGIHINNI